MSPRPGVAAVCLAVAAILGSERPATGQPGSTPPAGDQGRGRAVFAAKQCGRCHRPPGETGIGPALSALQRSQGGFELAGRLWNHTPAMVEVLAREGGEWPTLSAPEMADLMAYLGADDRRDPAPDPSRGLGILVRKGCLKCHALRGEGARVGPDLGTRRPAYGSAVAWAASLWSHTPKMAVAARERGVAYPRFNGEDLGHLVAYLRTGGRGD